MLTQQICSKCFPAHLAWVFFLRWRLWTDFQVHFSRTMAAPLTPPSILREFCPLYYLQNAIPSKVRTFLLHKLRHWGAKPDIHIGSEVKKAVQTCQGSLFTSVMIQHYCLGADAAVLPSWWSWKPFWPCSLGHSDLFPGVFLDPFAPWLVPVVGSESETRINVSGLYVPGLYLCMSLLSLSKQSFTDYHADHFYCPCIIYRSSVDSDQSWSTLLPWTPALTSWQ